MADQILGLVVQMVGIQLLEHLGLMQVDLLVAIQNKDNHIS